MASDLSNAAQVASSVTSSLTAAPWDPSAAQPLTDAMNTASAKVAAAHEPTGWLGFFGWLLYVVFNLTSTVLYWVVRLATISIPRLLYALFSSSWTVTMNATTLMFILVGVVSAASWVVRYRILNMYSRLPPEPQRKEPEIDLFPDSHEEGNKGGLASYP
ncbi:phosphatidylcholine and lysophosphatidylcholine phospholipase [Metarhizium acridum]|uniref:phosphatidylcholine and lysophosphatidylcholine phospholipase n=1 Tax=Metarhizium acridum TaxID=92637 RepID=UPI001C6BDE21|nr:phosphatidylcholine and lysophosphatidylcholine phospholipase [Metarhizium acridum]